MYDSDADGRSKTWLRCKTSNNDLLQSRSRTSAAARQRDSSYGSLIQRTPMTTVFGDTSRGSPERFHSFPSLFTPSTPVETYLGQGSAVVLPNANSGRRWSASILHLSSPQTAPVMQQGLAADITVFFMRAGKNTSASAVTISIQLYKGA